MKLAPLLAGVLLFAGCSPNVLPPSKVVLGLSEAELRGIVLTNTPIGVSRHDVEKALKHRFHSKWRVVDYEARGLVAARGFTVPVAGGDYYLDSDLAVVPSGPMTSDVASCYFLFSPNHTLKDVVVRKWSDGP
jgi:hypothetical protein